MANAPIKVEHLTKVYGNGHQAIRNNSFSVVGINWLWTEHLIMQEYILKFIVSLITDLLRCCLLTLIHLHIHHRLPWSLQLREVFQSVLHFVLVFTSKLSFVSGCFLSLSSCFPANSSWCQSTHAFYQVLRPIVDFFLQLHWSLFPFLQLRRWLLQVCTDFQELKVSILFLAWQLWIYRSWWAERSCFLHCWDLGCVWH